MPPIDEPAAAPAPAATPAPEPSPAPAPAEPAPGAAAAAAEPAATPAPEAGGAAPAEPAAPAIKAHSETSSLLSEAGKPDEAAAAEKKEEPKPAEAKPEAEKPVEGAAAEPAKVEPVAVVEPVKYEFQLPENVTAPPDVMEAYTGVLREHGIAPEVGQKLLDQHVAAMTRLQENTLQGQHDAFAKVREGWRNELAADEVLGGAGIKTTLTKAAEMRDMFVPKEHRAAFNQMMDVTGVGDHPAFIRFMTQIARKFAEPAPVNAPFKPPADVGKNPNAGKRGALYDHPTSARMGGGQ